MDVEPQPALSKSQAKKRKLNYDHLWKEKHVALLPDALPFRLLNEELTQYDMDITWANVDEKLDRILAIQNKDYFPSYRDILDQLRVDGERIIDAEKGE